MWLLLQNLGFGSEFALSLKTVDAELAVCDAETGIPKFDCISHEEHGITFSPGVTMEEMEERKRLREEKAQREVHANSEQDLIPANRRASRT